MSPTRGFALPAVCAALLAVAPASAQEAPENPLINYPGFVELANEVAEYRETRLLPWEQSSARALADGMILLDARSETAFAQGHWTIRESIGWRTADRTRAAPPRGPPFTPA